MWLPYSCDWGYSVLQIKRRGMRVGHKVAIFWKIRIQFPAEASLSSVTPMLSLLPWSRAPCSFECSVRAISLSCLHLVLGGRGCLAPLGSKHATHPPSPLLSTAKQSWLCNQLAACGTTCSMAPSPLSLLPLTPPTTCPGLPATGAAGTGRPGQSGALAAPPLSSSCLILVSPWPGP